MPFHAFDFFAAVEQSERRLPPLRSVPALDRIATMPVTRTSPGWLKVLFAVGLLGTFGGFIGAAVFSRLHEWPQHTSAPPLFVQMVSGAFTCFGLSFGLGLVHTAYIGSYYSALARRHVTRERDPFHFWLLLGIIGLLPLAIIVYGVWKFISV